MFEDQNTVGGVPPKNLPIQPPEDMLADVDHTTDGPPSPPDALAAGVLKRKDSISTVSQDAASTPTNSSYHEMSSPPPVSYSMKGPVLGKIFTFILVIILLGGLGVGGWWVYGKIKGGNFLNFSKQEKQTPVTSSVSSETIPSNNSVPSTSSISNDINNDIILFGEQEDGDKDNLSDRREQDLGTDSTRADTDGDGLNDGDEVLIWRTEPLNPDTDGDGYKDGEEVRNGYSPIGAGKLFDNTATGTATTSL